MKTMQFAAAAAVMAGAAAGLAVPASADPLEGTYMHTITEAAGGPFKIGAETPWVLSSCGPDCLHVHQADDPQWDTELHLQGNRWSGPVMGRRTTSFDKNTLVGADVQPMGDQVMTVGYILKKV